MHNNNQNCDHDLGIYTKYNINHTYVDSYSRDVILEDI